MSTFRRDARSQKKYQPPHEGKENYMQEAFQGARRLIVALLMAGGIGLAGAAVFAADEPAPAGGTTAPAESPSGSGGGGGKGRHPGRKACHQDVKKFCGDVQPGEGRIIQCLKQHTQELSPACAEQMERRGKRK
jgi:hypothetical protein